jgi:hypothetical protein
VPFFDKLTSLRGILIAEIVNDSLELPVVPIVVHKDSGNPSDVLWLIHFETL